MIFMKWVVGALIAVVVGWAAVSTPAAAPVSIDETSLKFLPADTIGIAFIDMNGLRSSTLAQDFLKTSNKSVYPRELQEFSAATGLKLEQDLDKITAAKISAQEGIVIAQGRIDRFKVEQFFKDRGQRTEAYLGQSFYVDGDRAVAVFDNLVVAGQLSALKKAIDHKCPARRRSAASFGTLFKPSKPGIRFGLSASSRWRMSRRSGCNHPRSKS
jgi:hypothetical protein